MGPRIREDTGDCGGGRGKRDWVWRFLLASWPPLSRGWGQGERGWVQLRCGKVIA